MWSEGAIAEFGKDHEYTQLCIPHKGIDPDDAFSTVPYEKGFHMIYYLDRLVGRQNFDKFIPYYFTKWTNKSLDSYEFKDTFLEFFGKPEYADLKVKIAEIDWEGRFYTRGLPPKPEFDTSLIDVCYKLSDQWKNKVGLIHCGSTKRSDKAVQTDHSSDPGLHAFRQGRDRLDRQPEACLSGYGAGFRGATLRSAGCQDGRDLRVPELQQRRAQVGLFHHRAAVQGHDRVPARCRAPGPSGANEVCTSTVPVTQQGGQGARTRDVCEEQRFLSSHLPGHG